MLPNLDQTRNTGLVTLPGAFIGALFGGASPVEAAMFQLTMLSAILVSAAVTGTLFSTLSGRSPVLPRPSGILIMEMSFKHGGRPFDPGG